MKTKFKTLSEVNQIATFQKNFEGYNPTIKARWNATPTKKKVGYTGILVCLIPGCPIWLIPVIRRWMRR